MNKTSRIAVLATASVFLMLTSLSVRAPTQAPALQHASYAPAEGELSELTPAGCVAAQEEGACALLDADGAIYLLSERTGVIEPVGTRRFSL